MSINGPPSIGAWFDDVERSESDEHVFQAHKTPGGTMLYLPSDSNVPNSKETFAKAHQWHKASASTEVALLRHNLRFEALPDWMRAPPAPMPFGVTSEIQGSFHEAFVRAHTRDDATFRAIDNYIDRGVWNYHPYVEDTRQFAVSITHNMAPHVLFCVGPIGFRRFGAVQTQARKMYFSCPAAFQKWVVQNYE